MKKDMFEKIMRNTEMTNTNEEEREMTNYDAVTAKIIDKWNEIFPAENRAAVLCFAKKTAAGTKTVSVKSWGLLTGFLSLLGALLVKCWPVVKSVLVVLRDVMFGDMWEHEDRLGYFMISFMLMLLNLGLDYAIYDLAVVEGLDPNNAGAWVMLTILSALACCGFWTAEVKMSDTSGWSGVFGIIMWIVMGLSSIITFLSSFGLVALLFGSVSSPSGGGATGLSKEWEETHAYIDYMETRGDRDGYDGW